MSEARVADARDWCVRDLPSDVDAQTDVRFQRLTKSVAKAAVGNLVPDVMEFIVVFADMHFVNFSSYPKQLSVGSDPSVFRFVARKFASIARRRAKRKQKDRVCGQYDTEQP